MPDSPGSTGRGGRLRVAVVDDSAVVRKFLSGTLEAAGMEVLFAAPDPVFAWSRLQAAWPDVIVLDVEMPRMDGISFLRQIMATRPTPVVMCSTLTAAGTATTLQALAEGAVGIVTKPRLGLRDFLQDDSNGLVSAVRAAARANVGALRASARPHGASSAATSAATSAANSPVNSAAALRPPSAAAALALPSIGAMAETTDRVIAIGSSTGGVNAVETLLTALPRTAPGIVIVQHMPAAFTAAMAARIDGLSALEVREARDGDRVIPGRALIAPGGLHMQLQRSGAQYVVTVRDGPPVNRHKPSVDVLFRSVASAAGRNAVGVILTGMGDDGARGLLDMRRAGAATAAQDEATSVVYGMPREAVRLGAAERELPLGSIAAWLMREGRDGAAHAAPQAMGAIR